MRSVVVVEYEPADLKALRIDLHFQFLEIRLSFRIHSNHFRPSKEWFLIEKFEVLEFICEVGSAQQKHQGYPIIESVFNRFSIHLLIRRDVEVYGLAIRYEKLLFRTRIFPPGHPLPLQKQMTRRLLRSVQYIFRNLRKIRTEIIHAGKRALHAVNEGGKTL